ncbi:MAG: hypothetical protein U0X40_04775 [Ferruginibacter sp.]
MKKTAFIVFLFTPVLLLAQAGLVKPVFKIQKGTLSLNGKTLKKPWQLDLLKMELGSNAAVFPGFNMVHTYNEQGIVLYESKMADSVGNGDISEIQVYFSAVADEELGPTAYFKGTALLENMKVYPGLTLSSLRRQMKVLKYTESKSYLDNSYRFTKAGIYIYFRYDITDQQLLRISFGTESKL